MAEWRYPGRAAIATRLAAEIHGLDVLAVFPCLQPTHDSSQFIRLVGRDEESNVPVDRLGSRPPEELLGIDRSARRTAVHRGLRVLAATGYVAIAATLGILASRYLPDGAAIAVAAGAAREKGSGRSIARPVTPPPAGRLC